MTPRAAGAAAGAPEPTSAPEPDSPSRPSVSVFVPCYGYGHLLPTSVGSVLSQGDVDVRVLVIDDASTDDSAEVAEALAAADARVEVLRHRHNKGHLATYNEGIEWADGDYTVLLSADDLLTPGALGRSTALLEAHPGVAFAYGFSRYLDDGAPAPRRLRLDHPRWHVVPGREWAARRCRAANNVISSPEVVVRTSAQKAVGGYSDRLPHSGDLEMWLRLASVGDVGLVRGVDQALYRRHRTSMSRTEYADPLQDLLQRQAAFTHHFATTAAADPDRPLREAQVGRALAGEALWRACRTRMSGGPGEVVTRLEGFATQAFPSAQELPEARALRVAGAGGRVPAVVSPSVVSTAVRRRAAERWFWISRRWRCL